MDRRRYSTMLVLAAAALVAEACSSSSGNKGTGGADGGSSSGGMTGTGGKADAGTGGKADAGTGGMTGTGGKTDGGTAGMTGAGGKVDAGDSGTGGMTGTGGKVDGGTTDATDTAMDMSMNVDSGPDADPAMSEKLLCAMSAYQSTSTTPFTAGQFCTLYLEICNDVVGARVFATEAECETAYNGYSSDADAGGGTEGPNGQKGCRTAHLCLANQASLITHCPHATGLNNNDAGPGGPCP